MAKVSADPQAHMDEKVIEDPELIELIEQYLDTKEAAKQHRKAKADINERVMQRFPDAEHGTRVRVGSYVLPIVHRTNDGFEVPAWDKTFVGSIGEDE